MLADTEWRTPHDRPGGGTVAEWVERVRWSERHGWLRPPPDPEAAIYRLCLHLCWRRRCQRAGGCRHRLPLALREFHPELGVRLAEILGEPPIWTGPVDPGRLALLRERVRASPEGPGPAGCGRRPRS